MNSLIDPARRLVQMVAVCAILSCFTTYVLTTHECKTLEGMPKFNSSIHHFGFSKSEPVAKHIPGFMILFLLISCVPLVVWECIRESRFHDEQRVSDNRKWMLISLILVIVSVVTMIGIGAMSTPKPFRHKAKCFYWGSAVAKSVCDGVTPLPAMLTKHKEGYLFEDYANSVEYYQCSYVANHRNNLILLVLYWCHYVSMIYHFAEILYYLVGALLGAILQWLCVDKNVCGDVESQ